MNINIQPIEKRAVSDGTYLEVHSIFYTIQGEGPFAGHPAVFVRLAGCNLQCPGCDTDYTSSRTLMDVLLIADNIQKAWAKEGNRMPIVVITGGEPFRQNISKLVNYLILFGYIVQIETNGSLPPTPKLHIGAVIICSPKTGKIHPDTMKAASAFKYVLDATSVRVEDGLPLQALQHSASPYVARPSLRNTYKIYLQPMDTKDPVQNQKNLDAVLQSCLKFGYILQLQIHKLIGVD